MSQQHTQYKSLTNPWATDETHRTMRSMFSSELPDHCGSRKGKNRDSAHFGVTELFPILASSNLLAVRRSSLWWKSCKLYQCPTAPRYLEMSTAPMHGSRATTGAHKLSHGQHKILKETHWTQSVRRAHWSTVCTNLSGFSDRILSKQAGLEFKSSLTQFPKWMDVWITYMYYGTQFPKWLDAWITYMHYHTKQTRYLFENKAYFPTDQTIAPFTPVCPQNKTPCK